LVENHFVDNEQEAVDFINEYMNNSTAFLMEMSVEDLEEDANTLSGSSLMHEFR
jgi:hypothetical protein